LLDWHKMKQNNVVEEYFDLLFNEDSDDTTNTRVKERPLPKGHKNSKSVKAKSASSSLSSSLLQDDEASYNSSKQDNETINTASTQQYYDDPDIDYGDLNIRSSVAALPDDSPTLSFVEFLRVNMRLAEDRVLSFVTVFSTGFGTKWIPGIIKHMNVHTYL
jgi:hypothetical protein